MSARHTTLRAKKTALRMLLEICGMLIGAVVLIIVGVHIFTTPSSKTPAPASKVQQSTTPPNAYAILSPASVAPKVAECSTPLTYQSSGDSTPLTCSNGDLNVLEWNALAALEPTVMTLGYSPSISQVESALCSDANDSDSDANTHSSYIIEETTYQISALYYGWHFASDPTAVLRAGC